MLALWALWLMYRYRPIGYLEFRPDWKLEVNRATQLVEFFGTIARESPATQIDGHGTVTVNPQRIFGILVGGQSYPLRYAGIDGRYEPRRPLVTFEAKGVDALARNTEPVQVHIKATLRLSDGTRCTIQRTETIPPA